MYTYLYNKVALVFRFGYFYTYAMLQTYTDPPWETLPLEP